MIWIIKKNGTKEEFDENKIINAVTKSAKRVGKTLSKYQQEEIIENVRSQIGEVINIYGGQRSFQKVIRQTAEVNVSDMHDYVLNALKEIDTEIYHSYLSYRGYKKNFGDMLLKVKEKKDEMLRTGDRENSNVDSTLVSTQQTLVRIALDKELYQEFELNDKEREAIKDGYIYMHDMAARSYTFNCCIFDTDKFLRNGFDMGTIDYTEMSRLSSAMSVLGDVILNASAQQYGGFTLPEIDKTLKPYAYKALNEHKEKIAWILNCDVDELTEQHNQKALKLVRDDFEQGWQGLECKLNSVGSSRGDYPFVTFTFGLGRDMMETMATETLLKVRKEGQGRKGKKKIVPFPKLVFLYDEVLHGEGGQLEWLFNKAIECSQKAMYPDYLSLTGNGYIADMYKQYNEVISPMGKCKLAHTKPCEPSLLGVAI